LGSPARIKSQLSAEQQLGLKLNADHYVRNARRYSALLEVQT
jgi:carbonic anhydrase/acetyltransferase-like protein (isoleucine patch superfamily)